MGNDSASFLSDEMNRLAKINAALLEALEAIMDVLIMPTSYLKRDAALDKARAALALVRGGE